MLLDLAGAAGQECNECKHTEANNRYKSNFKCLACGHTNDSDTNASINILIAGQAKLACGAFPLGSAVKQEPFHRPETA